MIEWNQDTFRRQKVMTHRVVYLRLSGGSTQDSRSRGRPWTSGPSIDTE